MQFFNLLATRTRRLSLFQQNPLGGSKTRNLSIFPAMLFALSFAVYVPFISIATTPTDESRQILLVHPSVPERLWYLRRSSRVLLPPRRVSLRPHLPVIIYQLTMGDRYGIVLLFIDEMRKYWNRGHPTSLLARIAW
jgi:sodium/potassium-transporting ATPase subunit alpha